MGYELSQMRNYSKHVGYHLEEIRLSSLPLSYRQPDDSEDEEVFEDSSNDDKSGTSSSSRPGELSTIKEEESQTEPPMKSLKRLLKLSQAGGEGSSVSNWVSEIEPENPNDTKNPPETAWVPNDDKCRHRLTTYITKEKLGLGQGLLKDAEQHYRESAGTALRLIDSGCPRGDLAIDLSLLMLYDLVILIGKCLPYQNINIS